MLGVRTEVVNLAQFQRRLKTVSPVAKKELQREFRAIGKKVAQTAKSNASWSSRIPKMIGVSVAKGGIAVKVRRNERAPHGPLYERGSKGRPKSIRHPVFGNRGVWVSTPTRPFLQPAADRHRDEAREAARDAVRAAAAKTGFS